MECMTGSSLARLGPVVQDWTQSCKDLNARLGPVVPVWVQYCPTGSSRARLDPVEHSSKTRLSPVKTGMPDWVQSCSTGSSRALLF